jgi:HD-GYP domain-containing protein (c-di-GMP phosphodiesterase class II)
LPTHASMPPTRRVIPTAAAAAAAAGAALLRHEFRGRQAAERIAAASLESLLKAIDANDAETGVHVRRVASYALILADAAGLEEHEKRSVERVALFHDIGKIHEALFDIIHDDSALTAEERKAIATHPQRGADVLAPLCGFYPDLPGGVLSHHERWDGTGYPRRLKGRRIPLGARVVTIADTFDAITHARRYRGGRSVETAREVILDGRGTQFDPQLVDLFVFPPVFARIIATWREVSRWRQPVQMRRTGKDEPDVPDITFRWRPERRSTRALPASDRPHRTAR